MTALESPPDGNVLEVTVIGPGYGECIILHIGNGNWVIVDSCLNNKSSPVALDYLRSLALNPGGVVRLVVATHWHDDHIKGIGKLVEVCDNADFCCASVPLHQGVTCNGWSCFRSANVAVRLWVAGTIHRNVAAR